MPILFRNENVEIVTPDTPGSIPVFTLVGYTHAPTQFVDICSEGLKSYNERRKTESNLEELTTGFARVNSDHYNYIYFRAPFKTQADDSWKDLGFEELFKKMYGNTRLKYFQTEVKWNTKASHLVTINVNPENTYVYYSDARVTYSDSTEKNIQRSKDSLAKSRRKLTDYLKVGVGGGEGWEIVVKTPHIPPTWFSSCLSRPPLPDVGLPPETSNIWRAEYMRAEYEEEGRNMKEFEEWMAKELEKEAKYDAWREKREQMFKKYFEEGVWPNYVAPTVRGGTVGGRRHRTTYRRRKSRRSGITHRKVRTISRK